MKPNLGALLDQAVSASSLRIIGSYTSPHSWGVYRIDPPAPSATRRFRKGNHPVRQRELEQEFGSPAKVIALFTQESLATELARLLNEDADAAGSV
jgi:hypothetical protein